ncbi:hypothetical protein ABT095_32780 [Kitasatospora sp. NPDC002227]|uniref:hypothetical protein n=1 Tax=Kitasatospora sp. NPDC002227 TaxID=3154773 RepID=UPI00332CAF36
MMRLRGAAAACLLAASVTGCSAAGSVPGPVAGTSTGAAAAPPARVDALVAPPSVGEAKKSPRTGGLSERMGEQLAVLFPEHTGAPASGTYDINRPVYFAGVSRPRFHSADLAGQADQVLLSVLKARNANDAPLTETPARSYGSGAASAVLRCAALTQHGTDRTWDMPVCAWADERSVGVVLDYSAPAAPGAADFAKAVALTVGFRTAAEKPGS